MPYRSKSDRFHDWDRIIHEARRTPGSWVVRLVDQPARLVRTVRDRAHPKLRLPDGRLEARIINGYVTQYGRRRGDIYIRFAPDGTLGEGSSNPPSQ